MLEVVSEREMPDISLQHLLAVMLIHGAMSFAAAHSFARVRDPAVLGRKRSQSLLAAPFDIERLPGAPALRRFYSN